MDGILTLRLAPGVTHGTLQIAKDGDKIREDLVGDTQKIRVLLDCRGRRSTDSASRRFPVYSGTERVAFVIESAVGRVLVQAWVVLTPRMCPNRAFDNEAKSVDWLLS
jgi:hypothetical protein